MENQYKSEGELYLLFNLLRNPGPHTASFLAHLMPIGWDNRRVIGSVVALAEKFGFKLSNFYFNRLMFETAFPKSHDKIIKKIKRMPKDKDSKLQKQFFENKFSLTDVQEELKGSFDKALDYIFGGQESVLEAVSFEIDIPSTAKIKLEELLRDYIRQFIRGNLKFNKKNFYKFSRHNEIFLAALKKPYQDYGIEFMISSSELDDKRFLFIHCLLAFEQLGYLSLGSLQANEEYRQNTENGCYEAQVSLRPAVIEKLNKIEIAPNARASKKESAITTLYLNSVGDLWREPKSKYCYPMGENSDRHKIIRYLTTHSGYQKTSEIALALEGKNEQTTRKEIGKIRGNIKKFLRVNGEDVIDSKKESGYRVGPNYKIQPKEEVHL